MAKSSNHCKTTTCCAAVQSLQIHHLLCCCRREATQKATCALQLTCSMHFSSMLHVCHAPCSCVIFIIGTGTQFQLIVWNLLGGSFHVIVLLHHRLCWLSECWQAARYVHTEAHISHWDAVSALVVALCSFPLFPLLSLFLCCWLWLLVLAFGTHCFRALPVMLAF